MTSIFTFIIYTFLGIFLTHIFEFVLQHNARLRERYYQRHEVLFGYHVHHSTIGLLFILIGIFYYSAELWGIGIGIIIMHTISSKRFVFIEKENFK